MLKQTLLQGNLGERRSRNCDMEGLLGEQIFEHLFIDLPPLVYVRPVVKVPLVSLCLTKAYTTYPKVYCEDANQFALLRKIVKENTRVGLVLLSMELACLAVAVPLSFVDSPASLLTLRTLRCFGLMRPRPPPGPEAATAEARLLSPSSLSRLSSSSGRVSSLTNLSGGSEAVIRTMSLRVR